MAWGAGKPIINARNTLNTSMLEPCNGSDRFELD
jgi:hypothetical protein